MKKQRAAAWVVDVLRERTPTSAPADDGLRERKKRETRQRISDTATMMFLERGFDHVRVAEVAEACGVSEKTVFNYFPTKESLVFDRLDDAYDAMRRALSAPTGRTIVESVVEAIVADVRWLSSHWGDPHADADQVEMLRRFVAMVDTTPSLRAAQADSVERMIRLAAEILAVRAGVSPEDPEPQMAGVALVGLWRIEHQSWMRHSTGPHGAHNAPDAVIADVRRAGRLIDTGLWCLGALAVGDHHDQLRQSAASIDEGRAQVVAAVRQARTAWHAAISDLQRH